MQAEVMTLFHKPHLTSLQPDCCDTVGMKENLAHVLPNPCDLQSVRPLKALHRALLWFSPLALRDSKTSKLPDL